MHAKAAPGTSLVYFVPCKSRHCSGTRQLPNAVAPRGLAYAGVLILAGLLPLICGADLPEGGNTGSGTIELRLAADPTTDAGLVRQAKKASGKDVSSDDGTVGHWVPVHHEATGDLQDIDGLVLRTLEDHIEVLVLVQDTDVSSADIESVSQTTDYSTGRPAIRVSLTPLASRRLLAATSSYLSMRSQPRMVSIIDGLAYSALPLRAPLQDFVVTGPVSDVAIAQLERTPPMKDTAPNVSGGHEGIVLSDRTLVVLWLCLIIVALGSFSLGRVPSSKHPRIWVTVGAILGAVLVAAEAGVSTVTASRPGPGLLLVERTLHIDLMRVLGGAVVGLAVGSVGGMAARFFLRRAVWNLYVVASRLRLKKTPNSKD